MNLVELTIDDVTVDQFKYLFENMATEAIHLTDECTSCELFCTEDG